jgi:hypothetical protein
MENKDSLLIRKMISLVESVNDKLKPQNEYEEKDIQNVDENLEEQVTQVAKGGMEILANILKSEKGLFSTLRSEIPALSKFKNADELIKSLRSGEVATVDAYKIIKQANKVPEIALKLKGLVSESPTFKEIVKKVYPKGGAMPADPSKFKLASETLQKTYGMTAKEAEALLAKGAQEMGSAGGVTTKIIDKAIKRRTAKTTGGKEIKLPEPPPVKPKVPDPIKPKVWDFWINKKWNWKKITQWGLPLGLTALALWWYMAESGEDVPDDFPPTPPPDDSSWAECIQDLINKKQGQIRTSNSGQVSVLVKPTDYPGGLQFYTNGRVMDVTSGKKGSWKCKDGTAAIQENLNESEIDVATMGKYVDTAVNDLDGFVDTGNLKSLLNIVKSLKGNTFQGKDALQEFLGLYKEDENEDFLQIVSSVGVKTLGTNAILTKREIINILKGGSSTPITGGVSIGNINITWDDKKGSTGESGGSGDGKKKINYFQCNDFPFKFGCINEKISQIQACLDITPQKGYFGPKTLNKIKSMGIDITNNVITKEIYNKIKTNFCGKEERTLGPGTPAEKYAKSNYEPEPLATKPEVPQQIKAPSVQSRPNVTPEQTYKILYNAGYIKGDPNDSRRLRYTGPDIDSEVLNRLDQYLESIDYTKLGNKNVWVKKR